MAKKGLQMLIVASKVKETNSEADLRTGGNFMEALNEQVHALIAKAQDRCAANGRSTLRPEDL